MFNQRKGLQLDYEGTIPTCKRLVGRCYKGVGLGNTLLQSYYEKLGFLGFTSSEAESYDQPKIQKLFANAIYTDKLEPASKGRFRPALAIEDFLENTSFFLGARDAPCEAPFSFRGDFGADISSDGIALARDEEQPEIEEDVVLELLSEQIADANTSLIELRRRVADAIARMEALDAAAKGDS